jgi:anhydro-N-acetylmuramic acid kinase
MKNKFKVIGLMSGTSLDGLDIALVEFHSVNQKWRFKIIHGQTITYNKRWYVALSEAHKLDPEKLFALHSAYGVFLGQACRDFMNTNNIKKVDFIASHGHTVFHQPDKQFTFQLGDANALHAASGIPVIADFRSLDIALGGQGAPLVPVGDRILFKDYEVCLNLGGIANLSMESKRARIAFDVCFCNMNLNYLMNKKGKAYDKNGESASSGIVNTKLLDSLENVYTGLRKKRPSLGRELFENEIRPLLDNPDIPIEDKLATCVESTAAEIASAIKKSQKITMLCTGGGAFNSFLISRLLDKCGDDVAIVLPEQDIIKFKEAVIFAFLGVLRVNGLNNCLKSVTGASRDSSGGISIGF